jgi:hypothetical protein
MRFATPGPQFNEFQPGEPGTVCFDEVDKRNSHQRGLNLYNPLDAFGV